jgi:hypothetical protein
MSLDTLYFERHILHVEAELSRMKFDLEQYALRETANEAIIDQRNKVIATFYHFTQAAREFLESVETEKSQAFTRGYDRGANDKEAEIVNDRERIPMLLGQMIKKGTRPSRYYDPEALRIFSIERAMNGQPDLFKTDYQKELF